MRISFASGTGTGVWTRVAWLLLGALSGPLANASTLQAERLKFQDAAHALETNRMTEFHRLLGELADYPAKPYLDYDYFRRRVGQLQTDQVDRFLRRYAELPFAWHARGLWLETLARRGDWETYLAYFDDRENTRLRCLAFKARLELGRLDGLNDEIYKVWLRGYSQPSECDPAFAHFLATFEDVETAIWLRIEKAFKARRPNLARYLGRKLGDAQQARVDAWDRAHRHPDQSLTRLGRGADDENNRALMAHALDRLARRDSDKALAHWKALSARFAFSDAQRNQVDLRIALSAAYQHRPVARNLLASLDSAVKNDQAHLWLARIQLRVGDWPGLLDTIRQMPAHLQQENEWQYWLARALDAGGAGADARAMLETLAGKNTYYGFLAADRLHRAYRIVQEDATDANIDEAAFLDRHRHLLRARELFYLDRIVDARREWFQALRHLEQDQIKIAATLASRWKWHDSAIRTVARTPHRSDYSLRFPMPYKTQVMELAQSRELDPALIYGIMRRESLFDPLARSRVGALGLMQLMPSTARLVARRLGLKKPRRADILRVENNLSFGTHYLKTVLDRFDNNVALAAAAYNAGPRNVQRWLPKETPMSADLWVETVPFGETRNYVQAVLAYSTVFDRSLGRDAPMSSRMDEIRTSY